MQLAEKHCRPCKGAHEHPLSEKDALDLLTGITGWCIGEGRLRTRYEFETFREAVTFLDKIADIAGAEEHTPDVCIESYNQMRLTLYTYCCGGLTENDFILAAKIQNAYEDYRKNV